MKAIKQFIVTLIVAIVLVIGAQVAVIKAVGKDSLRDLPLVGELFTVVESPGLAEEPKDERIDEIKTILATLKEREATQAEQDDDLEQLRRLKQDIAAIERQNRALFDRIRQLFPIIDEARQETLKVLAKKYEKMSPEAAAAILMNRKDEECAELLLVMQDRASAAVLEAIATMGTSPNEQSANRKRAAEISQLMRKTLLLSNKEAALFSEP
jgi:flagellar motility protein MotE (MotC chaperone)